jgi:hypothetical protein
VIEMLEQTRFLPSREAVAHLVGLRAQQPDINHNHQG